MANEEITLTFREAMNELSAIVEALESNTLELEESLVKYERGGRASALLKSSLADARKRLRCSWVSLIRTSMIRKLIQNFPRLNPA